METNLNIQTEQVKSNLLDLINNSNLPAAITYYLMKDIMRDVERSYQDLINEEVREYEKQQEQEQQGKAETNLDENQEEQLKSDNMKE